MTAAEFNGMNSEAWTQKYNEKERSKPLIDPGLAAFTERYVTAFRHGNGCTASWGREDFNLWRCGNFKTQALYDFGGVGKPQGICMYIHNLFLSHVVSTCH